MISMGRTLVLVVVFAGVWGATPTVAQSSAVVAVFADVWSLDPATPEIGLPRVAPFGPVSPADLFIGAFPPPPPPLPFCMCEALAFGFPDPAALENVDALSRNSALCVPFPPGPMNDLRIQFSIDRASVGIDPVITAETDPAGDGAAADIFEYLNLAGQPPVINRIRNNAAGMLPSLFLTPKGPGMIESNVDAWYSQGGFQVGNNRIFLPLLPNPDFYFLSVDAPTAAAYGFDPAVIYTPDGFGGLMPAAGFPLVGLLPGDDIDAMTVGEDVVYFSLSRTSPSLAANGWSAADILKWTPAGGIQLWAPAAALGLLATDNIDALYLWDPGVAGSIDDALTTSRGPSNQNVVRGSYFDIQANRDMLLHVRDLTLVGSSSVNTKVWVTTEGDYASKLNDPSGWSLVEDGTSFPASEGWPSTISFFVNGVPLACGEVRGFFVEASTSSGAPALGTNPTPSADHQLGANLDVVIRGGTTTPSASPGMPGTMTASGAPAMTVYYDHRGPLGQASPWTGGQAPQANLATLEISCSLNDQGVNVDSGLPGPYFAAHSASYGSALEIEITGLPNAPAILLSGPLNIAAATFPPVSGQLDIGIPGSPMPTGIDVVFDGTLSAPSPSIIDFFFHTDASGELDMVIGAVPASLVGLNLTFQALMPNGFGGVPFAFSNAVHLQIVP